LRKAADIDEAAARAMRALDQARADEGDDSAGSQDCDDNRERGDHALSLQPPPRGEGGGAPTGSARSGRPDDRLRAPVGASATYS